MRRPWYRKSTNSWFIELPGGRQLPLGKDERFKTPPATQPKEPPPSVQKKYLEVMQRHGEPDDRTLSFCISSYLDSLADCVSETRGRATKFLERFLKETGDVKVSKLKAHHLTEHVKGKGWKPNTVRAVMGTVNACLNHCEWEGWIDKNPLRGKVRLPKIERREEIMSVADRERLIEAAAEPFKSMLLFLEGTGLRPKEARQARVEKCELEKGDSSPISTRFSRSPM
jgi:integrase